MTLAAVLLPNYVDLRHIYFPKISRHHIYRAQSTWEAAANPILNALYIRLR